VGVTPAASTAVIGWYFWRCWRRVRLNVAVISEDDGSSKGQCSAVAGWSFWRCCRVRLNVAVISEDDSSGKGQCSAVAGWSFWRCCRRVRLNVPVISEDDGSGKGKMFSCYWLSDLNLCLCHHKSLSRSFSSPLLEKKEN
jgi:hypothetical protein